MICIVNFENIQTERIGFTFNFLVSFILGSLFFYFLFVLFHILGFSKDMFLKQTDIQLVKWKKYIITQIGHIRKEWKKRSL